MSGLVFNNDKTKVIILSTRQMSRVHQYDPQIAVSGSKLEVLNLTNCLKFTSMNILSGTITSNIHYLDATPLYQY